MCKAPRHGDTTFGKNQVTGLPSPEFHVRGAVQTPPGRLPEQAHGIPCMETFHIPHRLFRQNQRFQNER